MTKQVQTPPVPTVPTSIKSREEAVLGDGGQYLYVLAGYTTDIRSGSSDLWLWLLRELAGENMY